MLADELTKWVSGRKIRERFFGELESTEILDRARSLKGSSEDIRV